MTELTHLTISEALKALESKEFTSVELTQAHIDTMAQNEHVKAYITQTPDIALKQAEESDKRRSVGEALPLDGIPIAMKDMFCTKGVKTTAASNILSNFIPPYESTVSQKLWDAGAVMLGKSNTDEFAMGTTTESSYFGGTINPWKRANGDNVDLIPGGSSGGSAAAVAARLAMGATGTDTGGSIRQPAAMCGIVGIRPTYGRCSRWGIVAFASSFDQAGCFGRSVEDAALMLKEMSGFDPKDSTSAQKDVPDFTSALTGDVRGLKIGIPKEYRVDGMPDEIEKNWQAGADMLRDAGAEIVDISLPHTKYALAAYYILVPAEASSNLARYDGVKYGLRVDGEDLTDTYQKTRGQGFGDEVKRRIMVGTYALSAGYYDAYYIKAQKVRRLIADDFTKAFEQCDAILTPPTPSSAYPIGENADDPVATYLNDVFTVPVNLAGLPGISLPTMLDKDGLPLGLQLIGRPFDEETIFRVSGVLESAANFQAMPEMITKMAA